MNNSRLEIKIEFYIILYFVYTIYQLYFQFEKLFFILNYDFRNN